MKIRYSWTTKIGILLLFILSTTWNNSSYAQNSLFVDYHYILEEIESDIQSGNLLALRDAALLLERISVKRKALQLLQRYSLFTPREFTFSEYTTKHQFLNFFYKNQHRIQYSMLLKAFYITPLEERTVLYNLESISNETQMDPASRLRQHIQRFQQDIEISDSKSAATQIERIGQLNLTEAYQYLLSLLKEKSFKRKYPELVKAIIQQLVLYKDNQTFYAIIELLKEDPSSRFFLSQQLVSLTNVKISPTQKIDRYIQLLDSLGNINAMRQYGYDQHFQFRPYYFKDTVDYYGKILMSSDTINWIQNNVIDDLVRTKHPRSLYYLAVKTYRLAMDKDKGLYTPENLYEKAQNLLAVQLLVPNNENGYVTEPNWGEDFQATQNYIHYWTMHFEDFAWDRHREKFINQTISSTLENRYKLLIKRLTSTNDSVAWHSYVQLTEGKPDEIIQLTERYRPVLKNHNRRLPPIEYAYLERLSELTDFCKRNGILYQPSEKINSILDSLMLNISPKIRYQLEKKLLASVTVKDLTSLEYWACLYVTNPELMYSLAWVLDRSYTKYWDRILNDEKLLRLYLKKSYLFNRLGTNGICNAYLNKLGGPTEAVREKLNLLLQLETDIDIIQQVERVLNYSEKSSFFTWEDLLTSDFDLDLLNAPSEKDIEAIYKRIRELDNDRIQLKLLFYLSLHAEVTQVPYLIKLLQEGLLEREAVDLLKRIYAYDFQERGVAENNRWLDLWESDRSKYKSWGEGFIELKIEQLQVSTTLSINDINAVTTSPFYKEEYRNTCLLPLKKVTPIRNLRKLKIKPLLRTSNELKYLAGIDFKYRELLDVTEILEINDTTKLMNFLVGKVSKFDNRDQAFFYIKLLEQQWFVKYLDAGTLREELLEDLKKDLNKYLENRRTPKTEQDKAIIALVKLEMIGKTISIQLDLSDGIDLDNASKATLQQSILEKVKYEQLTEVIHGYNHLSPVLNYNVLNEYFGLPIFELSNPIFRAHLATNLKVWEEDRDEFYRYYLREFGVDFEDEKKKLDFDKIYNILKYDVVYPFAAGSKPRNYYVDAIIKLLEIHYDKQFQYNPNRVLLSEQSQRVISWMRFLEQGRTVREKEAKPNSFTYSYLMPASS